MPINISLPKRFYCSVTAILLNMLLAHWTMAGPNFKWVDINGGVHYGELKPINVPTEALTIEKAPPLDESRWQRQLDYFKSLEKEGDIRQRENDQHKALRQRKDCLVWKKDYSVSCDTVRGRHGTYKWRRDNCGNLGYLEAICWERHPRELGEGCSDWYPTGVRCTVGGCDPDEESCPKNGKGWKRACTVHRGTVRCSARKPATEDR